MTETKHFIDELPGYALGAVDRAEALQIEAHLSTCDLCRAELKAYMQVVEQLPLAVVMSEPGSNVKSRLMKRAASDLSESNQSAAPIKSKVPTTKARSSDWLARLSDLFQMKQLPLRLAGMAVLLLLVISNVSLWQRLSQLQRPAGFYIVELGGTERSADAKGVLVISDEGMEGTLVVEHLPSLDSDHQYQLWLIKNGKRTSGGVFSAGESGYGRLVVSAPGSLLIYDSFGVTIEPAGGSPGPTGDKVLGGDL